MNKKVLISISVILVLLVGYLFNYNKQEQHQEELKQLVKEIIQAEYQANIQFIKLYCKKGSIQDFSIFDLSHLKLNTIDLIDVKFNKRNLASVTVTISSSNKEGFSEQHYEYFLFEKTPDGWQIISFTRDI